MRSFHSIILLPVVVMLWLVPHDVIAGNTEFITTWRTITDNESITIPTHSESTYNYTVDWGDGSTVDSDQRGDASHTYTTAGTYVVMITGDFPRIYFDGVGDSNKIISIDQWGDIAWSSMESAFEGCFNLGYTAIDRPDLSKVNSMADMFESAFEFNGNISNWVVSNVNDMSGMFFNAGEFNQDIGAWDVGQVTDMNNMFASALSFDQNIGGWDVGQVIDMLNMFNFAISFNQDIGMWKVSTVTNMSGMFANTNSFNQDIGDWDVGQVTDMNGMFFRAQSFNQDIGDWDVGQVTDMDNMFTGITLSTGNYDALLSGWSTIDDDESGLQRDVPFHAGSSKFCNTGAKGVLVNEPNSWDIADGGPATGCPRDTTAFITTWQISPGSQNNRTITIPTHSESTYSYNVDWGDGRVDFVIKGAEGADHTYTTAGNYTISITGDFPRIYFDGGGDRNKIISIDQWGDIAWSSMESAFEGCANLGYTATDTPDLSRVSSMAEMFQGANKFNGNIDGWEVSTVTDMSGMFASADVFNQDIGDWDVGQVTDMTDMFSFARSFDQNIGDWGNKVGQVTDMSGMFFRADEFDQNIGGWEVDQVTNMADMFAGARSFNQNIGGWEVGQVTNMAGMFSDARSFNQNIGGWEVGQVTNMVGMFSGARSFNQNIGGWEVGQVTDMNGMFFNADSFNQDIGDWDVGQVIVMNGMFFSADAFDQDIGDWDVGRVTDMGSMFIGITLSTENYDALLSGWSTIDGDEIGLQNIVPFHAGSSKFCNTGAKGVLVNLLWKITDGGLADNCPLDTTAFITTWRTTTDNERITIPTHSGSTYNYNYNVDWGDGMVNFGYTGVAAHTYTTAGTYTVSITGDFPRIYFNDGGDKDKIISIDHWGDIAWGSMESAFEGCANLGYTATDTPDLSRVSSMAEMFKGAIEFNGNIGDWDVGRVINMSNMFAGASVFNQDIGSWDVGQVDDMTGMLNGAALSTENYDALLSGWSTIDGDELALQRNVPFHAGSSKFCNTGAKGVLVNESNSWDITDGGPATGCPRDTTAFITTWRTTTDNESITIPNHSESTYNYNVDWGDGMVNFGYTGAATHTYTTADTYTVSITGDFPRIYFNNEGDKNKIISIDRWGDIAWSSMESAFEGCVNLGYTATDMPDLSKVTSMASMFNGAAAFDGNIGDWDVGPVTAMDSMFADVTLSTENYDALLSGWSTINDDESDLQRDVPFHAGNSKFCNIGGKSVLVNLGWRITDGGPATSCSLDTTAFITTWRTTAGNERITIPTHSGSTYNYNVDWGDGMVNFGYIGNAAHTYTTAGNYTVSITGDFPRIYFDFGKDRNKIISIDQWGNNRWDSMESAFRGCSNLGYTATDSPDLSGVASMASMFNGATVFDGNIGGWDVSQVVDMSNMFSFALSFNQDINSRWDVSKVTDMSNMFAGADSFNQDIGDWDVGQVSDMTNMFAGITLSTENYDALLSGWSELPSLQSTVQFSAGNSKFCNFGGKGVLVNEPNSWVITDGGPATGCSLDTTAFITTWRTTTDNESITIPTHIGSTYNYNVDWGDGMVNFGYTGATTHTYTTASTYTVSITGDFPRIYFNNEGDKDKIISIDRWGDIAWSSMNSAFEGCVNLGYTATDTPDLSRVSSMAEMFRGANKFNGNIGDWDVGQVRDMSSMFAGADSFNQDIGDWDVGQVSDMTDMFSSVTFSIENYDALLSGWSELPSLQSTVQFSAGGSKYCDQESKNILTGTYLWTITDGGQETDRLCGIPYVVREIPDQSTVVGTYFSYTFPEDTFSNIDADTLTYTAVIETPSTNWLSFFSKNRTFSGTPGFNNIGVTMITVTADDGIDGIATDTFILTVINRVPTVNEGLKDREAFVGVEFSYSIPSDAFSDDDLMFGDTLIYSVTISTTTETNWLSFDSADTFSGTPPSINDIGISTIMVTATDFHGGRTSDTFTVTVINRVPAVNAGLASTIVFVGADFSYKIPENAFRDDDIMYGDTLTYTANINPQGNWLTFSSETRTFSGSPRLIDIGISTITVTATDLNGGSVNSSFTVTVPNRPPIQIADLTTQVAVVGQRFSYKIPENAFIDPDDPVDGTLSYSTDETLNWLMFSSATRTFFGTPTSTDPIGISTVSFTVTDPNGGSVNSDFILNVVTVNTPPTLNQALQDQMTYVNQALNYSILENAFSDPDGGSLLYSAEGNPNWLSFDTPTLIFSGTPPSINDIGISTITVTATDLNGGSTSDTFTVTVVNRVPTVNEGLKDREAFVGVEFSYSIPSDAFSDGDIAFGDTLTYTANINPQNNWLRFSFSSESRTFSSTPTSTNDIGISTITVTATDLNGGSTSDIFTVTVGNRVPTVKAGLASTIVFVGGDFSYKIPETAFSDGDIMYGDTLTYTANINPQDNWLTFSSETRIFTGSPRLTDIGISTITVTATDLNGGSVNSSFTVTVPNRPPIQIADLTTQVAVVGQMFSYKIPENAFIDPDDPDGGTLLYSTDENLNWLMFSSATRTFSGNPPSEASTGINTVLFTVTDPNGGSVNSDFILNVVTVNTPPTLNQALQDQMNVCQSGIELPNR